MTTKEYFKLPDLLRTTRALLPIFTTLKQGIHTTNKEIDIESINRLTSYCNILEKIITAHGSITTIPYGIYNNPIVLYIQNTVTNILKSINAPSINPPLPTSTITVIGSENILLKNMNVLLWSALIISDSPPEHLRAITNELIIIQYHINLHYFNYGLYNYLVSL